MTSFFICIILIGIFIVCFSLVWMVIEKKKVRDYRLDIDERRYELQQVIEDADQLLIELNNYSDYIVNRIEEKQQALENVVKKVDQKQDVYKQINDIGIFSNSSRDQVAQDQIVSDQNNYDTSYSEKDNSVSTLPAKKGKLIPLNERKREVIKLYKKGIDSTEIAKMMNMGKGEIELIFRMIQ